MSKVVKKSVAFNAIVKLAYELGALLYADLSKEFTGHLRRQ